MADEQRPRPFKMRTTPAELFRGAAFIYVFINVIGIVAMAAADAQQDYYHFRLCALLLIGASGSLVVSAYLTVRRSWAGQPPSDLKDGVLPTIVIFALGWLIWTLMH